MRVSCLVASSVALTWPVDVSDTGAAPKKHAPLAFSLVRVPNPYHQTCHRDWIDHAPFKLGAAIGEPLWKSYHPIDNKNFM